MGIILALAMFSQRSGIDMLYALPFIVCPSLFTKVLPPPGRTVRCAQLQITIDNGKVLNLIGGLSILVFGNLSYASAP